jgi:hypothetical protein
MEKWDNELRRESDLQSDLTTGGPGNGARGATVTKLPSKVLHAVRGGVGTVAGTVSNTAETVAGTVAGTVGQQSSMAARKVSSGGKVAIRQAKKNALYVSLGLFAIGFVLGVLVPRWLRRDSDEKITWTEGEPPVAGGC